MIDNPIDAYLEVWHFLGSLLYIYLALNFAKLPTAYCFPIAAACWAGGLFWYTLASFQRQKPYIFGSRDTHVDFPPYENMDIPEVQMCRRCVHLTKDGGWLSEHVQLIGTCNISGQDITNQDCPFECINYYSGNSE